MLFFASIPSGNRRDALQQRYRPSPSRRSVFDIHPVVGHRTATKCWSRLATVGPCQTRAWLSTASIPGSGQISGSASRFRCWHRRHTHTGRKPTVYRYTLLVLFNKVASRSAFISLAIRENASSQLCAAICQNLAHDIPGSADGFRVDVIQQTGPFRAQRTTAYRRSGSPSM